VPSWVSMTAERGPLIEGPGRALGIDLGDRRIGVALSDDRRRVATPLVTVTRSGGDSAADHRVLIEHVTDTEAVVVVVGMPFSLSGKSGPAAVAVAEEVELLGRRLLASGLRVALVTHDERLTTVTASAGLRASGRKSGSARARRDREVIDNWLRWSCFNRGWTPSWDGPVGRAFPGHPVTAGTMTQWGIGEH